MRTIIVFCMMTLGIPHFTSAKDLYVTWEEYCKLGEKLAQDIHKSAWEFDQILFIPRGGMIIGDMMTRMFNKPYAVLVASSYQEDHSQRSLELCKNIAMTTEKLGSRILLVDDLVDSGMTLEAVKKELEGKFPGIEIRTAVIWYKKSSKFKPDYYVDGTLEKETWIHQPFEAYDGYVFNKPEVE